MCEYSDAHKMLDSESTHTHIHTQKILQKLLSTKLFSNQPNEKNFLQRNIRQWNNFEMLKILAIRLQLVTRWNNILANKQYPENFLAVEPF